MWRGTFARIRLSILSTERFVPVNEGLGSLHTVFTALLIKGKMFTWFTLGVANYISESG